MIATLPLSWIWLTVKLGAVGDTRDMNRRCVFNKSFCDVFAAANHFHSTLFLAMPSPCNLMTLTQNLYAIKLPLIIHHEL